MLRGLKLTRVLQRAQNRKSTKAFWFLSAQIIWYRGVLVLYNKKGFARSCHWKNEKPGPTKAWTQYWQNNFSSRRGDHNTIHPLSVLKAPRPYILKKLWWVSIFNSWHLFLSILTQFFLYISISTATTTWDWLLSHLVNSTDYFINIQDK